MIAVDGQVARHVARLLPALRSLEQAAPLLERWAAQLAARLRSGGTLRLAGNGGSAAEAQHLAAELVGRYQDERMPLPAQALTVDPSIVTALLNDYGADEVFARQVRAAASPPDVLLLLSTSGRSRNLLCAAEAARLRGVTVWAMTGPPPNPLARLADEVLAVEAETPSAVQEVHLVAIHALCECLDRIVLADRA